MSEVFLGQISIFPFGFTPHGFLPCDGRLLAIGQNQALFSLLGTQYGGDGRVDFALPDLRGRVALHFGQGPGLSDYSIGQQGGQLSHTVNINETPAHVHGARFSSTTNSLDPTGNFWAADVSGFITFATTAPDAMSQQAIGLTGGSQPHNNLAPFLTLNFCIATQGIFPSRN